MHSFNVRINKERIALLSFEKHLRNLENQMLSSDTTIGSSLGEMAVYGLITINAFCFFLLSCEIPIYANFIMESLNIC